MKRKKFKKGGSIHIYKLYINLIYIIANNKLAKSYNFHGCIISL